MAFDVFALCTKTVNFKLVLQQNENTLN